MSSVLQMSSGRIRQGANLTDPFFDTDGGKLFHVLTVGAPGSVSFPYRANGNSGTSGPMTWTSTATLFSCSSLATHVRGKFKISPANAIGNTIPADTWFNAGGTFVRMMLGGSENPSDLGRCNGFSTKEYLVAMASFQFYIESNAVKVRETSILHETTFATNLEVSAFTLTYVLYAGAFA